MSRNLSSSTRRAKSACPFLLPLIRRLPMLYAACRKEKHAILRWLTASSDSFPHAQSYRGPRRKGSRHAAHDPCRPGRQVPEPVGDTAIDVSCVGMTARAREVDSVRAVLFLSATRVTQRITRERESQVKSVTSSREREKICVW